MQIIVAWLIKKGVIASVIGFLSGLYFIAVFAFFVYIIDKLVYVYHLIQSFLNTFSSFSHGSSIVDLTFSLANVSGLLPAFNASLPLLLSGIVFIFMRLLFKYTLKTYHDILQQVTLSGGLF